MSDDSLSGRTVRLVPLSVDHAEALFPSASDPEVWRWMPRPRPESLTQLRTMLSRMPADHTRRCFAVRRVADGTVIGSTSLYELDLAQNRAEIGATWFDRSCWGGPYTRIATKTTAWPGPLQGKDAPGRSPVDRGRQAASTTSPSTPTASLWQPP